MKSIFAIIIFAAAVMLYIGCRQQSSLAEAKSLKDGNENTMNNNNKDLQTATFASGCFWCAEAIFERVEGVHEVVSGYAGGTIANPSYEDVCTGTTGHAEAIQVTYDSSVVSYDQLLKIFWKTHDPTTLNRQGNDVGTQYRSAIFYNNDEQKEKAEKYKDELNKSGAWKDPIVTQIAPLTKFYRAEDYHQDYYKKNPYQGYCQFVIGPKVEKFEKVFAEQLKK